MEEDIRYGLMAQSTKVIGKWIKPMVEEDLFMPTETSMMDIGRTIRPMDTDNILIPTVPNMKDTG